MEVVLFNQGTPPLPLKWICESPIRVYMVSGKVSKWRTETRWKRRIKTILSRSRTLFTLRSKIQMSHDQTSAKRTKLSKEKCRPQSRSRRISLKMTFRSQMLRRNPRIHATLPKVLSRSIVRKVCFNKRGEGRLRALNFCNTEYIALQGKIYNTSFFRSSFLRLLVKVDLQVSRCKCEESYLKSN